MSQSTAPSELLENGLNVDLQSKTEAWLVEIQESPPELSSSDLSSEQVWSRSLSKSDSIDSFLRLKCNANVYILVVGGHDN